MDSGHNQAGFQRGGCLATFSFVFSPIGFRRITSAIWMASGCLIARSLPRQRDSAPRTWAGVLRSFGRALGREWNGRMQRVAVVPVAN